MLATFVDAGQRYPPVQSCGTFNPAGLGVRAMIRSAKPAPLGPGTPAPTSADEPEGKPDLQGKVTGVKKLDEIEVGSQWIRLYGIVDRGGAQHIDALLRYVKPSRNVVVCYRKALETYRCYADGQDIARLALRDGIVQLAPNAPPEYRQSASQRR